MTFTIILQILMCCQLKNAIISLGDTWERDGQSWEGIPAELTFFENFVTTNWKWVLFDKKKMKKMHLKIISQSKIINYCSNFQHVQFDHFAFNYHLLIAVSYLIHDLDAKKEGKDDFSKLFDSVRGLGVVCIVFG